MSFLDQVFSLYTTFLSECHVNYHSNYVFFFFQSRRFLQTRRRRFSCRWWCTMAVPTLFTLRTPQDGKPRPVTGPEWKNCCSNYYHASDVNWTRNWRRRIGCYKKIQSCSSYTKILSCLGWCLRNSSGQTGWRSVYTKTFWSSFY